jgi:DNA modification methylase
MSNWAKIYLGDSRLMPEVGDETIDLAVTSPPYWHIKDYGVGGQIGYGQSLHQYLIDLYYVWAECFRILRPGCRLCINIGDQFARSVIYGRYKVIPLHAEFIAQGEKIGFDFMGAVIWQKKTTLNTTGGANVMGSYPYPPNGLVEIDYEFILIFKKPGPAKKVLKEVKEASKLSKAEWKEYFAGHWHFGGARQIGHEAMFPEELPRRLIKMFTFQGDTVLDPFLGSGTSARVALELGRNAVGYEVNDNFLDIIKEKIGVKKEARLFPASIQLIKKAGKSLDLPILDYVPAIQDARPQKDEKEIDIKRGPHNKVVKIIDENTLKLNTGQKVGFLGVKIDKKEEALRYLHEFLLGRNIILKYQDNNKINATNCPAYVYLKNKIFVNSYLIKSGLGSPDLNIDHRYKKKFIQSWKGRG